MNRQTYRVDGVVRFKDSTKYEILENFEVEDYDVETLIEGACELGLGDIDRDKVEGFDVRIFEKMKGYNVYMGFMMIDLPLGKVTHTEGFHED